jgi:gephyrin
VRRGREGAQKAAGAVLSKDVVSKVSVPPYDASRLDGYAVRAEDVPGTLALVGKAAAGSRPLSAPLGRGEAVYVTTGGPVPPGADAVVAVEVTEQSADGTRVHVRGARVSAREGTRGAGSDMAAGALVARQGSVVDEACLGLLYETQRGGGRVEVEVHRAPVVGVLSTGDEIADDVVGDANRPALLLAVERAGGVAVDLGVVRDDRAAVSAALGAAAGRCDVVVSTGGVSMGATDHVKGVLEALAGGRGGSGSECGVRFGRLNMKPGKPTVFAVVPRGGGEGGAAGSGAAAPSCVLMFGLPGNPVSALVTFSLLVRPALLRLRGLALATCVPPRVAVRTLAPLPRDPSRPEYQRARVWVRGGAGDASSASDARIASTTSTTSATMAAVAGSVRVAAAAAAAGAVELEAVPTGSQVSSRLASVTQANALLLVGAGADAVPAGSFVSALLLHPPLPFPPTDLEELLAHARAQVQAHAAAGEMCSCGVDHGAAAPPPLPAPARPATHPPHDLDRSKAVAARVVILVVSDRVSRGDAVDAAGPALAEALRTHAPLLAPTAVDILVVPDEVERIREAVLAVADAPAALAVPTPTLLLTSGGTGFAPRDVTPEAVAPLLERQAPGLVTQLMLFGLSKTPTACLSRPVAGTRGRTLLVTLPGSPKAVREGAEALGGVLPHALRLLAGL